MISADLKYAAQARPGTRIRFAPVSQEEAVRLRREEEKEIRRLEYEMLYSL